jgi:formylglycine-generating enzyme required for sulfatase activity
MANFYGQMEYDSSLGTVLNPIGTDDYTSFPVGSYEPNAWGLYDMHGNVREWCLGGKVDYPGGTVVDPPAIASSFRVNRGGSWFSEGRYCRSADRYSHASTDRIDFIGFRIVLAPGL